MAPLLGERVEDQGVGEGGLEVVGGGSQDEEVAGESNGLDGEVAGDEGRVAEEEMAEGRVRRERDPDGRDRIEGKESYAGVVVIVRR